MNQQKQSPSFFIGLMLIIFGAIFILRDMNLIQIHFDELWPIFPTLVAVVIWINFLTNIKNYELIMPATILSVYSAMFWSVILLDRLYFSELWPIFILGPALGFWLMMLSPYRTKSYWVPALILTSISVIFMVEIHYRINSQFLLGFCFVLIGIIIALKKDKKSQNNHSVLPE